MSKRLTKIRELARDKDVSVRDIFVKHILTPARRAEIGNKMMIDDEDDEFPDLDQMCDTPTSQERILSYF